MFILFLCCLQDVLDAKSGKLEVNLQSLVDETMKHVDGCLLCQAKGFHCEICQTSSRQKLNQTQNTFVPILNQTHLVQKQFLKLYSAYNLQLKSLIKELFHLLIHRLMRQNSVIYRTTNRFRLFPKVRCLLAVSRLVFGNWPVSWVVGMEVRRSRGWIEFGRDMGLIRTGSQSSIFPMDLGDYDTGKF